MMRLGRLPHSPAAVSAAPSLAAHRFAAVEPRPILDRRYIDYQPLMCGNQTKPVCTIAGLVNGMLAAEAVNNRASLPIDQGTVDPFYASIAGCAATDAAIEATDGLVVLDVLKRQLGGFNCGLGTPSVGLFGTLPNRIAIANAMDVLGFAYVGVDLHEADMEAAAAGKPWTDATSDPGALVGGHLIVPFDYLGLADDDMGRAATWGALQPLSWAWLAARMREAYGLAYRFLGTAGALDAGGDTQEAALARWAA
jgi:hypothetical protein